MEPVGDRLPGVEVRWADLSGMAPDWTMLTGEERCRADRFRRPADADLFAHRRNLTRAVVADILGVPPRSVWFDRSCPRCGDPSHGRPVLRRPGAEVGISVSSSSGVVAVALGPTRRIGIDIERVGTEPGEDDRGSDAPTVDASTWTQKEAVLKAFGVGLRVDPRTVVVAAGTTRRVLRLPPDLGLPGDVQLSSVDLRPDVVGHVAVVGQHCPVVVRPVNRPPCCPPWPG